jgi:cation transport ATPase
MVGGVGRAFRLQLGAFLTGCLLLGVFYLAKFLFGDKEVSAVVAISDAILLGAPLVFRALKDLWHNRTEMSELAALNFMVSFGSAQYQVAALIALFLVGSQPIEYRSQIGARRNLEALLRLAPYGFGSKKRPL